MDNIFNKAATLDAINKMSKNTLVEHLKIEYTEIGSNSISAKMPVNHTTHQPFGMLHGGASVVLAETLGSIAANLTVNNSTHYCVGLDINANHIRSVMEGFVYGTTTPIHLGKKTQVWHIDIKTEEGKLVCVSRLTIAVIERK